MLPLIRNATSNDLESLLALQNSYVQSGFVGMLRDSPFELEERKLWFSQFSDQSPYQILIATDGSNILGYTASFQYRGGGAFSKTIETSIYTSLDHQARGTGSKLYAALFEKLSVFDLHLAVVGIAIPNEASIKLHKKFGFEEVGIFKEYASFKGNYISSMWMQKKL